MTPQEQQAMNDQVTALQQQGLGIDGSNTYKTLLLECAMGAILGAYQGATPPPEGHWAVGFHAIGAEERARRDGLEQQLIEARLALLDFDDMLRSALAVVARTHAGPAEGKRAANFEALHDRLGEVLNKHHGLMRPLIEAKLRHALQQVEQAPVEQKPSVEEVTAQVVRLAPKTPEAHQLAQGIAMESLAALLNGSQYPFTPIKEIAAKAKAAGLVIVYGASDDLVEFDGALYDEVSRYDGGTVLVDSQGVLDRDQVDDDDDEAIATYHQRSKSARRIEALWGENGWDWSYETDIPHATFEILEGAEPYCRGIVFAVADLVRA